MYNREYNRDRGQNLRRPHKNAKLSFKVAAEWFEEESNKQKEEALCFAPKSFFAAEQRGERQVVNRKQRLMHVLA